VKKRFTLGTVLALMLLVAVTTVVIAYSMVHRELEKYFDLSTAQRTEFGKFIEARNDIQRNFIGAADDNEILDGAIRGMLSALDDKYSHYLNAEEYEKYRLGLENQFVGIGITASLSAEGDILVSDVYEDSPAKEQGLAPFDRVIAVEGTPVSELGYELAVSAMTGEENTRLKITVLRAADGSVADITLVRRRVDVQAVYSEILSGQNIGLIRVRNFDLNVDRDFREALERLLAADVSAVIFDLRNNPGGQLDVMCPMLDALLPEGTIITMRDKNGNVYPQTSDAAEVTLPMAVLVNENTYSAAEFFAAALREYDKASLVGEPTTGKGYAQATIRLTDGSALILSTMEYFTPKGKSLSGTGLKPDVTVTLTEEERSHFNQLTHEQDRQLQAAIDLLTSKLASPEGETA
jgi:carboxyl-terminal processing protease